MIARSLISDIIFPLKKEDTGEYALSVMNDNHIRHLPVVEDDVLLGILSEDDVLEHDIYAPIESYGPTLIKIAKVLENAHIYEVIYLMSDIGLTTVPVVNNKQEYLGLITQDDLVRHLGSMGAFTEPGSIVVLELQKKGYSLAEISRIVEGERAALLSSFISSSAINENWINVTLKINKQDIKHILATFERFDYTIKATYQEADYIDDTLQKRYEALMLYMNV